MDAFRPSHRLLRQNPSVPNINADKIRMETVHYTTVLKYYRSTIYVKGEKERKQKYEITFYPHLIDFLDGTQPTSHSHNRANGYTAKRQKIEANQHSEPTVTLRNGKKKTEANQHSEPTVTL